MMVSVLFLLCIPLLKSAYGEMAEHPGLVNVLNALGWKKISFGGVDVNAAVDTLKLFSQYGILANSIGGITRDAKIVVSEDIAELSRVIARNDVLAFNLLFHSDSLCLSDIREHLDHFKESRGLLILNGGRLFSANTFESQNNTALAEWTLSQSGDFTFFRENFNLEGAHITSSTLPFKPWTDFGSKCKADPDEPCSKDRNGDSITAIVDTIASMFNFTWSSELSPSGDWGTQFKYDILSNGTVVTDELKGNFGEIVKGLFDFSASKWTVEYRRSLLVDFTIPISFLKWNVFISEKEDNLDYSLFFRPFAQDAWLLMILLSFLLLAMSSFMRDGNAKTLTQFLFWIFFVFMHSFYSGALTMYFSAKPEDPFTSLTKGIALYPKWKPVFVKDFHNPVSFFFTETAKYQEFIDQCDRDGLIVETGEELLEMMTRPNTFTFIEDFFFRYEMQKYKQKGSRMPVRKLGTPLKTLGTMIFKKNSPYVRIFNKGLLALRESGFLDIMLENQFGQIPTSDELQMMYLGMNQTGLAFIAYSGVLFVAIFIFCSEYIMFWFRIQNEKHFQ